MEMRFVGAKTSLAETQNFLIECDSESKVNSRRGGGTTTEKVIFMRNTVIAVIGSFYRFCIHFHIY